MEKQFDDMIDALQKADTYELNSKQQEAFVQKYHFHPQFSYGRDEHNRYIIRATKDMMKQLNYYVALKFDDGDVELCVEAKIQGKTYVSVSYREQALHLQELFRFLEENR